jgi:hypothetical protein
VAVSQTVTVPSPHAAAVSAPSSENAIGAVTAPGGLPPGVSRRASSNVSVSQSATSCPSATARRLPSGLSSTFPGGGPGCGAGRPTNAASCGLLSSAEESALRASGVGSVRYASDARRSARSYCSPLSAVA